MQDFNYLAHGIFEITLEVSCCKFPVHSELEYFWIENQDALVNYLLEVNHSKKHHTFHLYSMPQNLVCGMYSQLLCFTCSLNG